MTVENSKQLDIKSLKKWAQANLPPSSTLREVLLREADTLSIEEFLAKSSTWMKIVQLEELFHTQKRDRFA